MKPHLFVDFYKTISFSDLWHTVQEPHRQQIEKLLFSDEGRVGLADSWMRGKITSEDINKYLSNELGIDYQELWDLFIQSAQTLDVNSEAINLIQQLQSKYVTVLFTDNMDSFNRFTIPAYKLDTVFNKIINSADVGFRKSDMGGEIFKLVTNDLSNSILLDDKLSNCQMFEELGGTGLLVTEANDVVRHLHSIKKLS